MPAMFIPATVRPFTPNRGRTIKSCAGHCQIFVAREVDFGIHPNTNTHQGNDPVNHHGAAQNRVGDRLNQCAELWAEPKQERNQPLR